MRLSLVGPAAALAYAMPEGLRIYLAAIAGMTLLMAVVSAILLWKTMALRLKSVFGSLFAALFSSVIALAVICLLEDRIPSEGGIMIPRLVLLGALFGVVYMLSIRFLFVGQISPLIDCLPIAKQIRKFLRLREEETFGR